MSRNLQRSVLRAGTAAAALCLTTPVLAQAVDEASEEIVVTARKGATDTSVQDAPFAITGYSDQQLEALNFRNLSTLTVGMPNVQVDEATSVPGTAVFSIRGLGIASTVPSIDPTVGVFVDGVYMGINSGILLSNFDLEGIEVLRGPQGVLFGRNVTGGAILIRTRKPSETFDVRAHASVESGLRYRADASVSGPVTGGLSAKLAVLYDNDTGWFTNHFNDKSFGRNEQIITRAALRFDHGNFDSTMRFEHGVSSGDGPVSVNSRSGRPKFSINIDNPGFTRSNWDQIFSDTDLHVPLGDGKITNVFGWRRFYQKVSGDLDGLPIPTFNINLLTRQHQISEELRYAGTFGPVELTVGGYYFRQHLLYIENRILLSVINSTGGGRGDFSTRGLFGATDISIAQNFKVNLGLRYTRESKDAEVGAIVAGSGSSLASETLVPTFFNSKSWQDLSPKVGFQWEPSDATNLYGFWAKGFRSGGYNFRVTNKNSPPGPTEPESMDSYELGLKQDFADGAGRVNLALFRNTIRNVQRDITTVGLDGIGPAQQTRNSGDVRIEGAEIEARLRPVHNLLLSGNVGYTHGKYTRVIFDLSGDGLINGTDLGLKLTRLAPWSYGASILHDLAIGSTGTLSTRLSYNHRDKTFIADNNGVVLPKIEMIDFNLSFAPTKGDVTVSLFGTNLLNRLSYVSAVPFGDTAPFGGDSNPATPSPQLWTINRGRVIGVEVKLGI